MSLTPCRGYKSESVRFRSIKTQLIIFLGLFALFLTISENDWVFLLRLSLAAGAAAAIETLIVFLKRREFIITESSVITGLILGYVLSSDNPWWVAAFASSVAICSKHFIRISQRHIFNPAAFGIFAAILLFGANTQWHGTYLWYIIVPAGLYFSYRIRRIELLVGYFLAALVLFSAQALMQKEPLGNIFGYFSYFFIFVMLVEPKTTPFKPACKIIFGIGVAVMIFFLTEAGARFDTELAALLAGNLFFAVSGKYPVKKEVQA